MAMAPSLPNRPPYGLPPPPINFRRRRHPSRPSTDDNRRSARSSTRQNGHSGHFQPSPSSISSITHFRTSAHGENCLPGPAPPSSTPPAAHNISRGHQEVSFWPSDMLPGAPGQKRKIILTPIKIARIRPWSKSSPRPSPPLLHPTSRP